MARDFDGSADYGLFSGTPNFSDDLPLTMACFAQADNASHGQMLMFLGEAVSSKRHLMLFISGNTHPKWGARHRYNESGNSLWDGADIVDGQWYHVAGVFVDNSDRTVYVDGTAGPQNTDTITGTLASDRLGLAAEFASSVGGTFDGKIAEAAVWAAALNPDEIGALAHGFSPLLVRRADLVAYWPLRGVLSPERDWIGAHDLTLTGSPAKSEHYQRIRYPTQPFYGIPSAVIAPSRRDLMLLGIGL